MKNLIATLLFTVASGIPLLSQQLNTFIILDKESSTPIPFAIVSNLEKTQGGDANEEGVFDLSKNGVAHQDTLLISAIGYDKRIVSTKSIEDTLYLVPTDLILSEVVVVASAVKNKNKTKYLGVKKKKHDGIILNKKNSIGSEYAVRMEKVDIDDRIDHVYIYFVNGGAREAPFRVKIYNDVGGHPGKILDAVIVKPDKKLKNWSAISLSKENITQDEKIFYVAFQSLKLNDARYTFEMPNGDGTLYSGQILGMSRKCPDEIYYMRSTLGGTWYEGKEIRKKLPAHFKYHVPMIKVKMKPVE